MALQFPILTQTVACRVLLLIGVRGCKQLLCTAQDTSTCCAHEHGGASHARLRLFDCWLRPVSSVCFLASRKYATWTHTSPSCRCTASPDQSSSIILDFTSCFKQDITDWHSSTANSNRLHHLMLLISAAQPTQANHAR
jgi:hypothetical protein